MGNWAREHLPAQTAMTDDTHTATLTLEKETKNTYCYAEANDDEPAKFGKLYVQKWAVDGAPPEEITMTVEIPERVAA